MTVISLCRFIQGDICSILWGMLIMGEAVHVWGQGVYRKSVTFVDYSSKPKVALKNKY